MLLIWFPPAVAEFLHPLVDRSEQTPIYRRLDTRVLWGNDGWGSNLRDYGVRMLTMMRDAVNEGQQRVVCVYPCRWCADHEGPTPMLGVVTGHLNLQGWSPLIGEPGGEPVQFLDMSVPYSNKMTEIVLDQAGGEAVRVVHAGVGESVGRGRDERFLSLSGADTWGIWGVQENLAARAAGLEVLSLAVPVSPGYDDGEALWNNETRRAVTNILWTSANELAA